MEMTCLELALHVLLGSVVCLISPAFALASSLCALLLETSGSS